MWHAWGRRMMKKKNVYKGFGGKAGRNETTKKT
jgi:hypothetical protein